MPLLIAIDYDRTFTAAPDMWTDFIRDALRRDFWVVLCTARPFPPQEPLPIPVICTGGRAKRDFLAAGGVYPDIWIDDDPASILTDDPSTN